MSLEQYLIKFGDLAWGYPLLVLLLGGGCFFLFFSRLIPFRYLRHSIQVLRGKYDDENAEGDITHFQALSSALAATVGMGNISGVAIAVISGGPGAVFWMWLTASLGMATKFFTCTLAIMFRGKDYQGRLQGGPMYVIREGLSKNWQPLAYFFAFVGVLGCSPLFVSNQLASIVKTAVFSQADWGIKTETAIGFVIAALAFVVIIGGIKRIAQVAERLVPTMILVYILSVLFIIILNIERVPETFALIFTDAFTAEAASGGALGTMIRLGVRRAAFSNEAGIGTEAMAHGAAKTNEPVREGLVAMWGPVIDTLVVCTMTSLALILTGVYKTKDLKGVEATLQAFKIGLPTLGDIEIGQVALFIAILTFSFTTIFTYSYYGGKCLDFLIGKYFKHSHKLYNLVYVAMIVVGASFSMDAVISFLDGCYALMAIPTMVSSFLLAPKVLSAARKYFAKIA